MTKPRGPEDFSSPNCQVLVCCWALCSLSHPIYISFFLFFALLNSWRLWLGAGREGDTLGGDTSSSSGVKPPRSPTAGQVWRGRSC